jgi:hypothetical protein
MSELKTISCTALAVLMSGMAAHKVVAVEPGDYQQYMRGITIGDALGASPPPGVYFENTNLYAPGVAGRGQLGAYKANALLDSPTVYWSSGYNFLGAAWRHRYRNPFIRWEHGATLMRGRHMGASRFIPRFPTLG